MVRHATGIHERYRAPMMARQATREIDRYGQIALPFHASRAARSGAGRSAFHKRETRARCRLIRAFVSRRSSLMLAYIECRHFIANTEREKCHIRSGRAVSKCPSFRYVVRTKSK